MVCVACGCVQDEGVVVVVVVLLEEMSACGNAVVLLWCMAGIVFDVDVEEANKVGFVC